MKQWIFPALFMGLNLTAATAYGLSTPDDGTTDSIITALTAYNPGHCASDKTGGGHSDSDSKHDPSKHTLEDALSGQSPFAEVATAPKGTGGTASLHDKCFHLQGQGADAAKLANVVCYGGDSYAGDKDQAAVKKAIGHTVNKDGATTVDMAQNCGDTKPPDIKDMKVELCDCPSEVNTNDASGGGGGAQTQK